jgi:molybdopterin molybdotransferase
MAITAPDWSAAREIAHGFGAVLGSEVIGLAEGDRRVLAQDLRARTPLPPHAASAMDGWAVCGPGPWTVVDDLRAGELRSAPLVAGTAAAIATGAVLPLNARGILRSEHGELSPSGVLSGSVVDGQDVRSAGEEAVEGELLMPTGTRMTPAHIGLAAAAGHDRLVVVRRPRARFLVLGDELLRSGHGRAGKVRDSLGPQVPAWLVRIGVEVVDVTWVADTLDAHVDAFDSSTDVDIVVTSGGTATGPVDYVRRALEDTSGELAVDTVAVRPGHPMMMGGWAGSRWLIGLPGNPQAAVVALMTLGAPLVDAMLGRPLPDLGHRTLAAFVASRGERTRLVPCVDRGAACEPTEYIGSGMLRGLAAADGFAVVPRDGGAVGDAVEWLPLP